MALGWKSYSLTGSKTTLALVLMAHGTAMLATLLIGGALADRYPRRTLMIISDLARLSVMVALTAVDVAGRLDLGLLIALAVCYGLGDGFFYPAFGGIVPLVVDQHHVASANALIGLSRQGAFVAGPALAALLYGLAGSASVFAFNAASFLVAAVLMAAARPRAIEPEPPKGTLEEIADGVRYVIGVPWLWISIFLAAFILMIAMAPYTALLPAFVQEQYGGGVGAYGALFTVQSLGMAIGSLVFGQINPSQRRVVIMYLLFALNDVCVVAMALTTWFEAALILVALRGLCIGFARRLEHTPDAIRSREQVGPGEQPRLLRLLALVPVGYALTAILAGTFAPSTLLIVGRPLGRALDRAARGAACARSRMRSPEQILRESRTIALVGASPDPTAPATA